MEKIRLSQKGDERELAAVWREVFGDGDEYIGNFFRYMYEDGRAACIEENGVIAAMAFSLDIGKLRIPGMDDVPCSYVYAVATRPEYRSRGFGAKVTDAAAEIGGGVSALCPAELSLFGFYAEKTCYSRFFKVSELRVDASEINPSTVSGAVAIDAGEYADMRESLLSSRPHIALSERAALYQEHLCKSSGGGFYRLPDGGVFAAERYEGALFIKELLCGDVHNAVPHIAALGGNRLTVRLPQTEGMPTRDFVMLRPKVDLPASSEPGWFGFVFD